jgi:hypothetical protein
MSVKMKSKAHKEFLEIKEMTFLEFCEKFIEEYNKLHPDEKMQLGWHHKEFLKNINMRRSES